MYRLMKSETFTLDHLTSRLVSSYRRTQVEHFQQLRSALGACEVANNNGRSRYQLLNESGQEYYAVPGSTDHDSPRCWRWPNAPPLPPHPDFLMLLRAGRQKTRQPPTHGLNQPAPRRALPLYGERRL